MILTVVMSAYNSELYIADAIESVLCQTYRDFEFIIVDNFSNDSTIDIINLYASRDQRIKLFMETDLGLMLKIANWPSIMFQPNGLL